MESCALRSRALGILVALAATASVVRADPPAEEARRRYERGSRHYSAGELDQAIDEFMRAYNLYPATALLFNIAQAHRAKKDYEGALFFYTTYLRVDKNAPEREFVLARMKELRSLTLDRAPPAATSAPILAPSPSDGGSRLAWGIATAGGGALALATGIYFGKRAADASDEISALFTHGGTWNAHYREVYGDGRRDGVVSAVALSVGAAGVLAGGVLTYMAIRHRSRAAERPTVTVSAAPLAHGAALGIQCDF